MIHNSKRILLVGGGTGGHVTPLIAVIEELLASGVSSNSIFLVTDHESAKMDYVSGHQIEVHTITSGKFNRFFTFSNLLTPFKVVYGFFQSLNLLKKIKPDLVLAKGAYLSAPLVFAASILKIPIYLHESDSVMGASNQRLAKYAQKIFVSYPVDFYRQDLKEKLIFSGLPIRRSFFDTSCHQNALQSILIWGGSQGAERINEMIIEKLSDYLEDYEIYHICGEKNFEKYDVLKQSLPPEKKNKYHLYGILGREIFKMISQTSLVVSRAGSSLFELAALGKPAIVIPLPAAASDHQTKNAEYFAAKKAVIVAYESEINSQGLENLIFELMEDKEKRRELEKNIQKLAPQGAAEKIVKYLLE